MNHNRVLALLPARGGSKGISGPNTRLLAGKPLNSLATSVLSKASIPSGKIISTVDSVIADVAKKSGLEIPWLRPEELATDTGLVVDVIGHASLQLKTDYDESFSHAALVQATIPTVLAEDIDAAIRLVVDGDPNPLITGFPAGSAPPFYNVLAEIRE